MSEVIIYELNPDVITEKEEVIDVISEYEVMNVTITQAGGVFEKIVNWDEINDDSVFLGKIPSNSIIDKCLIEVIEPMEGDIRVTVGDSEGRGRIATVFDSELEFTGIYNSITSPVKYELETEIKAYFPTGYPTQGKLRFIINYN